MLSAPASHPGVQPEKGFLEGFKTGLTEKSWVALLGALVFCFFSVATVSYRCSERRLAHVPESHFLAYSGDDYGRLTHRVLRRAASREESPTLVLMGSSGFHEALTDQNDLNRRWQEVFGQSFQTEVLTAHQFSFEERTAAIKRFGPFKGLAVISINPRELHRPAFQLEEITSLDRLGFSSSDSEGHILQTAGWNYYSHRRFFSARPMLMAGFRRNTVAHEWHHYHERPRTLADMRRILLHDDWYRASDLEWNLRVLHRLITTIQHHGVPVVLVEMPTVDSIDPDASKPALDARRRRYHDSIGALARQTGAIYLDFGLEAGLRITDFVDPWHIGNASARSRFTDELVRRLTPLARPKT